MLLRNVPSGYAFDEAYAVPKAERFDWSAFIERNLLFGVCLATGNIPMGMLIHKALDQGAPVDTVTPSPTQIDIPY